VSKVHSRPPARQKKPRIAPPKKPTTDREGKRFLPHYEAARFFSPAPHETLPPVRTTPHDLWIYLALFLATFAVYAQVRRFDFINFDDPEYVTGNPHVRVGITPDGLIWAITSGDAANWLPLTRLSHMLHCQLFGLQSGPHHLTNVLLHVLATLLLFAFLNRATQARWRGAFVAFLFALHPLHVESVAWVAERKDVLCALFWFLALWAYVRYSERHEPANYLLALFAFCLGLMAKPMILTLPFMLLLLDFWPLRRMPPMTLFPTGWWKILWEKVPFFVVSLAAVIITYLVQQDAGAVKAMPPVTRVANALVSYVVYMARHFGPPGWLSSIPIRPRSLRGMPFLPVWRSWQFLLPFCARFEVIPIWPSDGFGISALCCP